MITRLFPMSSSVALSGVLTCSKQGALRSSGKLFVLNPISQIFRRTLPQRYCLLSTARVRVTKSTNTHVDKVEMKKPNVTRVVISNNEIMSFDEYKKNHLMSFEHYTNKYKRFLGTTENDSNLLKLQKEAYDCYVIMSYKTYKEGFFPRPNRFIL